MWPLSRGPQPAATRTRSVGRPRMRQRGGLDESSSCQRACSRHVRAARRPNGKLGNPPAAAWCVRRRPQPRRGLPRGRPKGTFEPRSRTD